MRSTRLRTAVLSAGALAVWWCWADPEGTGTVWRPEPPKLQQLEDKAEDRDTMARRVEELQNQINTLEGQLSAQRAQTRQMAAYEKAGRLEDLERKALGYETLQVTLEKREQLVSNLTAEVAAREETIAELRTEIGALQRQTTELDRLRAEMQAAKQALQDALEQAWLGNFEYYTVSRGDTLESIAAKKMVYEDASRAVWIRQANQMRVEDFENLIPGEVLLIPRFPPSGRYDF